MAGIWGGFLDWSWLLAAARGEIVGVEMSCGQGPIDGRIVRGRVRIGEDASQLGQLEAIDGTAADVRTGPVVRRERGCSKGTQFPLTQHRKET